MVCAVTGEGTPYQALKGMQKMPGVLLESYFPDRAEAMQSSLLQLYRAK